MHTPHVALSGRGASAFARKQGFPPFYQVSPRSLERFKKIRELIGEGKLGEENPRWQGYDVESLWNYEDVSYEDIFSCVAGGAGINDACEKGVCSFPREIAVGIIGISRTGFTVMSNREMAHYALVKEG